MARELAISMERGMLSHHQISAHNKTLVLASVNSIQYPSFTSSAEWSTTNYIQKPASQFPAFNCLNWGLAWTPAYREKFIRRGKQCNN